MAAIKSKTGSVLLAALALPGLIPNQAVADNAPEQAIVAFKDLYYGDAQPGLKRITVNAPSIYALAPLGESWSVEAATVVDSLSGASPRYYSTVSGASQMHDNRVAADARATYYRERSAYSVSISHSQEHDYVSNAASLDAHFSTADNNTTFNVGVGAASDTINPVTHQVENEHKKTYQGIAGITQALTPIDLVQLQLGYSDGSGYFSDPYKLFDNRPRKRGEGTALLRWNHHFDAPSATLRLSYRYYSDSFAVHAHTLGLEWVQPVSSAVTLVPALRYYMQSSASFYYDPPPTGHFPAIPDGAYSSLDQRLAAFGALEFSTKLEWRVDAHWSTDLKAEYYEQRPTWRVAGGGSPGLDPFRYVAIQFGLSRRF